MATSEIAHIWQSKSRLLASKPHRRICLIWCIRTVDGTKWAEVARSRARRAYIIEKKRLCVTTVFQMLPEVAGIDAKLS